MSTPRTRFERWWGSGVVWQVSLVFCAFGTVYYTRMQALDAEATGREALAKIQAEAKSNFEKLQETVRVTNERLLKLETSRQLANQETAINNLQNKLAELETKYKAPEDAYRLRSAFDDIGRVRQTLGSGIGKSSPDRIALLTPELERSTSSLLKKNDFLERRDKKSLQEMLDEVKLAHQQPPFISQGLPKFDWKPMPIPREPTAAERVGSFAKSYGFLIVFVIVAVFSRKR